MAERGTIRPMSAARGACLLSAVVLALPAWARDPLSGVDGTEEWEARRRAREREQDVGEDQNAPDRGQRRVSRKQLREMEAESDEFEETQFRVEQERRAYQTDRSQLKALREERGIKVPVPGRRAEPERRKPPPPPPKRQETASDADVLEQEARRLEERTARNLERSGITPAGKPASKSDGDDDIAPKRGPRKGELDGRPASPAEGRDRTPAPTPEPTVSKEEQRRYEEEHRRALEEIEKAEEERRRSDERKKAEEAARAAAAAKAAERKANEEAAKKLGGKLDKDGQFIDPDLDHP